MINKLYDKFKGVSGIHPFSIISMKCREIKSMTFTEASFATMLKKTIEQVLPEIVDMAADGFLRYDSNLKLIFGFNLCPWSIILFTNFIISGLIFVPTLSKKKIIFFFVN